MNDGKFFRATFPRMAKMTPKEAHAFIYATAKAQLGRNPSFLRFSCAPRDGWMWRFSVHYN